MSAPDKARTCGKTLSALTGAGTPPSQRLRAALLMSSSDDDTVTFKVLVVRGLLTEIEALRRIADPSTKAAALLKQAEAHSASALRLLGVAVVFAIVGGLLWVLA